MQIGISTTAIDSSLTHGHMDGIGIYTKNLLSEYHNLNQSVVPIMYPPLNNPRIKPKLAHSLVFPYAFPVGALAALMTPSNLNLNKQIEKKISIFHATDYLVPKFKRIPVVATLHDAIIFKHPEWCSQSMRGMKNWLLKSSVKWANHFITGTAAVIPELVEYWGVNENKIDVIHHGIDDAWLKVATDSEKNQVLEKYNLSPQFLLSVGTLQPRKNIDRIIQAFKLLPEELQREYKLVIVGQDGWQAGALLNEIQQLNNKGVGVWLKYVPFEDLKILYQCAKLFLFPSLHEGFGLPILEAFASKVPVITSNLSSMPEIAGDAAYLVDPFDVTQLQHAIQTLLRDENLCQNFIAKGALRVRDFSWKKSAEQTLLIYQKLIT